MLHVHRMRPVWVLLMSPAWADGWHQVCTHCRCLDCGHEAVLSAWQSPRHLNGLVTGEDEASTTAP